MISDEEFHCPVQSHMRPRRCVSGRTLRGDAVRPEAQKAHVGIACPLPLHRSRDLPAVRQITRKDRGVASAIEDGITDPLACERCADDARKALAIFFDLRFARRTQSRKCEGLYFSARVACAIAWPGRQVRQDRLEPVMARLVQMISFGGGNQNAVDPPWHDGREPRGGPRFEARQDARQRRLEIGDSCRTLIDRSKRVDENDLPVETSKMIAKEGLYDSRFVGFETAFHHVGERAPCNRRLRRKRERQECQERRPFEFTRALST